ncbi:MAG: cytochrome b N-terminal domain-containing protein [Planctomycetota bacterium]|nr:cytochrome b N-terminal domain-containing protein [Planctomycetota bacterium]
MNERIKQLGASLCDWFDDRTGYRDLTHEALYENIPGGSRWIYVTGSMLVFAFVTQAVTGIFLWMYYSPGSQNAWESVYYITNIVKGGWLLRGVHHYMAQMMIVLLLLHLMQVVLCKAYTAPREINYWLGIVLMKIVLALGLTGYLLPWDQKGYWATKVATELMSLPPGGELIQKVVVGGSEYGHSTLTRFFAMHAGVLPALLIAVLALHVAMFRKHGITAHSSEKRPDEAFWPMQVFKDSFACFAMLAFVIVLTCYRAAELGPPAEPTESYGAARPEWYFLFLFQLLKHCGTHEFVGAIVIPGAAMGFLFALPLIAKVKYGHIVNCTVILVLVIGAGYLTYEAIDHDNYAERHSDKPTDPAAVDLWKERTKAANAFHEAQETALREYERTQELIDFYGIPKEGAAVGLVRIDPEIQGRRLFKRKCASCHSYLDKEGHGIAGPELPEGWESNKTAFGGPNLHGFASREWIEGLLSPAGIVSSDYFEFTAHGIPDADGAYSSDMVTFVRDDLVKADVPAIAAALSAEAGLLSQREQDKNTALIEEGRAKIADNCTDCHTFHEAEGGAAPDLTGYGSAAWLAAFIANPDHDRFYMGNNDRMPAFAEDEADPAKNLLTPHDIDMLVRWLRGDDADLHLKLNTTK